MKMSAKSRAIDKIYKRRNRYEIPDWQREKVWDKTKRQKLIDSILRGWRLPKFYFRKVSEDQYEVVDGQQRLNAIYEFFGNELPLSKKNVEEFGGEYYRDLSNDASDFFDDFEIEYDEIEDATDKELKEFFQRLQEGLPLTSSEKLNSVDSKLRDFCRELAKHPFFVSKVNFADTRYAYFDVASKVAAMEIEGVRTGLRYDDLKEVFSTQAHFSTSSAAAKNLRVTYDFLDRVFVEKSPLLRNRTLVQSVVTLAARIIRTERAEGREREYYRFVESFVKELNRQVELGQKATDKDYIDFQKSVSANTKEGARIRQEILLRKLLTIAPGLADLFDPTIIQESGIKGRIQELGESITTLVAQTNALYSSKHGEDLFKPTNKTTTAQLEIRKPIKDLGSYQSFIDHLYFLFYEGSGSRLDGIKPQSFVDINKLRTELQHDVDHGDQGKIRRKRTNIGQVFQRYSGQTSPYTYPDELFAAVQSSLLTVIEADLKGMMSAL